MDIAPRPSAVGQRADAGVSAEMDCVIVRSAAEMARILWLSHPHGARDFARALHERACQGHDTERVDFWRATMDEIANHGRTCR